MKVKCLKKILSLVVGTSDPYTFSLVITTKGQKDNWYDTDKEIQDSELKIQYLQTTIETLTEIVNNITFFSVRLLVI